MKNIENTYCVGAKACVSMYCGRVCDGVCVNECCVCVFCVVYTTLVRRTAISRDSQIHLVSCSPRSFNRRLLT